MRLFLNHKEINFRSRTKPDLHLFYLSSDLGGKDMVTRFLHGTDKESCRRQLDFIDRWAATAGVTIGNRAEWSLGATLPDEHQS